MNAQSSYTRPDETLCLENLHIGISGLVRRARFSRSRLQFFFLRKDPQRNFEHQIGAGKSTLSAALGKVLGTPLSFSDVYTLFAPGSLCWRASDLPVYFEPVIDNTYLADFYQGTRAADVPTGSFCLSLTLLCASPCTEPKKYSFPLQIYLLNNRFRQVPVRAVMSDRPVEPYVLSCDVVVAVLTP